MLELQGLLIRIKLIPASSNSSVTVTNVLKESSFREIVFLVFEIIHNKVSIPSMEKTTGIDAELPNKRR